MILIVSSSLNTESNSRLLAAEARRVLEKVGQATRLLDLRDHPLPLCDGGASYSHANVAAVNEALTGADAILVATAIYNYDANAAVKNLIELTGSAWENKPVGFLCAAGGMSSYMSIMSLANSLMLDFRSVIVPRFVYATGDAFSGESIKDPDVLRRVAELAHTTAVRHRLKGRGLILPGESAPYGRRLFRARKAPVRIPPHQAARAWRLLGSGAPGIDR